MIFLSTIMKL